MDHFNHNGQPNRWASYDTGAASVSLCLQATALGMCTHQMGGFSTDKAREVFNLPTDCSPMSMIAVGYQDKVEVLDDDFKENELATRSRAPLNERFFVGQWGLGVE
jgi:nitroreductase